MLDLKKDIEIQNLIRNCPSTPSIQEIAKLAKARGITNTDAFWLFFDKIIILHKEYRSYESD